MIARSVSEAERLARPGDFDFLGLITDGYSQLRRYAPTLLESFDFRAAPVVTPLMDAIETLRAVNRDKARTIPGNANTDFVSRRWRPYVFTEQGIDRRFYELCVLSELKNRLRSGDVWVVGSRQFKDFDTYLLDSKLFAELRDQNRLSLPRSAMARHCFTNYPQAGELSSAKQPACRVERGWPHRTHLVHARMDAGSRTPKARSGRAQQGRSQKRAGPGSLL